MQKKGVTLSIRFVSQVGLFALAIGSLAAIEVWYSYRDATGAAERWASGLVRLMAEQTERTIQAVDLTLLGMRNALLVAPSISSNDPSYRAALEDRLRSLPYVRGLFVVGPDGFIAHATNHPAATSPVNLADRPYFQVHRDHPELGLWVGQPLQSRAGGHWFVSMTRRIENADRSFGGVAVAVVEPRYFQRLYEDLPTGHNSVIALMLRDGTLLARTPNHDGSIGTSYANASVHRLAMTTYRGVTWGKSSIDGINRVIGYQLLTGAPVIVVVGLAEDAVYHSWREHASIVGGGTLLVWALATVLALLWRRYRLRETQEQMRLAQVQRLEMMGRIAGGIAHDLGNTLRVTQSTFRLLKPSLSRDQDALELVNAADQSLKSAFDIIDRLLMFARRERIGWN